MTKQRLAIADRPSVFKAIDRERYYQSLRWPVEGIHDICEVDSELMENRRAAGGVRKERLRSVGTWLGLIGEYLNKAGQKFEDNGHKRLDHDKVGEVMEVIREVAALAVGCLEQHGVPQRDFDNLDKAPGFKKTPVNLEADLKAEAAKALKAEAEALKAEEVKAKGRAEVTAAMEKERLEARDRAKRAIDRWVLNERIRPDQRQDELVRAYSEIDRCAAEQLAESLSDIENAGTDKCNCEVCRLRKLVERVVLGK